MKGHKVLMSSASDEWSTPQDFFDKLNEGYKFTWDAAATAENTKCKKFSSDSLGINWPVSARGYVWCNPPYSLCKEFVAKAREQQLRGVDTIMLIPARTDTKYWHEIIDPYASIIFLKGRLKFGDSKNAAPFPSALVIFDELSTSAYCRTRTFWDWRK